MNTSLSLFNTNPLEQQLEKAALLVKSGMVPPAFKTPEAVLVACTIGHELGFSPIQALNVINVIDGKPTLGLNGYLALIAAHGGRIKTLVHTETECRISVTRDDHSHEESYTMAEAAKAGLAGKSNWTKMPKKMLFARAVTSAARVIYADIVSGLYETDEIKDFSNGSDTEEQIPAKTRSKAPKSVTVESDVGGLAKPVKIQPSAVIDIPIEVEVEVEAEPALPFLSGRLNFENTEAAAFLFERYEAINGIPVPNGAENALKKWARSQDATVENLNELLLARKNKDAG